VDELYTDVGNAVRKSPGIAIGIAAVAGFALARVIKSGLAPDETGTRADRGGTGGTGGTGTGTGGSTGA
jgi:hypothetical protein